MLRRIEYRFKIILCSALLAVASYLPTEASAIGPCTDTWPGGVAYVPSVRACGNKAAAVVWGPLLNIYSIVVRDCLKGDRDPCYATNPNSCATARSSPFKVQKVVRATIRRGDRVRPARIFCFKEAGNSVIYRYVRSMTIKRTPIIRQPGELVNLCLTSRTRSRNAPEILSTGTETPATSLGYTPICSTQRYLACDYAAVSQARCNAARRK